MRDLIGRALKRLDDLTLVDKMDRLASNDIQKIAHLSGKIEASENFRQVLVDLMIDAEFYDMDEEEYYGL